MSERKQEEQYFERIEREKKEKLKAQLEKESAVSQSVQERMLHWNKCGKCGASMDTKMYRGVEIELCSRCGAVLLDAGELEKLAGADSSGFFTGVRSLFGMKD